MQVEACSMGPGCLPDIRLPQTWKLQEVEHVAGQHMLQAASLGTDGHVDGVFIQPGLLCCVWSCTRALRFAVLACILLLRFRGCFLRWVRWRWVGAGSCRGCC
jgi:hypothetical protein